MTSPVSPPASPPRLFDRARVARNRDKAAANYPDYAFLKARVSRDIAERLEDTSHDFPHALELGAHDGQLSRMLMETGKIKQIEATDVSPKMVERMQATGLTARQMDEEMLEVEPASLDLIVSALSLHWVNDLPGTLIQIRKALKPDGLFLGALFGAGTLAELRACLMEAETELKGGIAPRISPLPGLQDLAALMQRAGFTLPVVDRETVTVRYASPLKLLEDLKGMGERAAFMPGTGQPLPRSVLMRTLELYLENYRDLDGKIRASFEIVHLSGWAPADSQPRPLRPGSAKASLADAIRKHGTA
ncbi:MAG: methyltransferase domain-containing protein [Alphaproteobacteria bacterium]|nr:SAM-dependent methyltransferase [Hyphomonas sp.]MBR9806348.1 methyltransferase domain-containing protein [Alphaproteobacteria bacterium]|tara:strand:+ start:4344 stop:5258 length:915 start_codon:yes stop_codon:yes gene_type:complete